MISGLGQLRVKLQGEMKPSHCAGSLIVWEKLQNGDD